MSDWKPIETAPKDGTIIIAYSPHDGRVRTMQFDSHEYRKRPQPHWRATNNFGIMWDMERQPTHWMPLPEPPKTEGTDQ